MLGAPEAEEPEETGPFRKCIVSGESMPKEALMRFVLAPDGRVVADLAEKLPGRGMWVSARREAVETAAKKGLFAKAARRKVAVDADLAEKIEAQLRTLVVDALHLSRRSGALVTGFEKVRQELADGGVKVLLHAHDGSADGKEKLDRLAGKLEVPILEPLSRDEMAQVAGRENAVHMALKESGTVALFVARVARLSGFTDKTAL